MRLFFKHLFRSIIKKPLQPFVLVFTLTIAISVSIFSFVMRDCMAEEVALKQTAKYGQAQISVTLNGTSQSRFMFVKDVESIVEDKAAVAGTFELPFLYGEEKRTVFGVATDFYTVGKVFSFDFTSYGTVTPSYIGDTAFITQSFASEQSLDLGDRFRVEAFGGEKEYTVRGISASPILGGYDVMVDITGVVRLLANDSLLVSALGDQFKPCSSIYVHAYDKEDVENCYHLLKNAEIFSDKTVTHVEGDVKRRTNANDLVSILDVSVLLTSLLAAAVSFCCFYILSAERTEENYSFMLSGAKDKTLHFMQYAEVVIYWAAASLIGLALVPLFIKMLFPIAGFRFVRGSMSVKNALKGIGIFLLVSLATVALFIEMQKRKKKVNTVKSVEKKLIFLCLGITALLCVALVLMPMEWRFVLYLLSGAGILFSLFIAAPALFHWLMGKWNASMEKRCAQKQTVKRTALYYACKNLYTVKILHNISRLISVLVCVVLTVAVVTCSAMGALQTQKTIFNADYVVLNATESCEEKIQACETVENCHKICFYTNSDGNLFSIRDISALGEVLNLTSLPKGNQAVMASGEATRRRVKVGDEIEITVNGKDINVVISEIVKTPFNFILFDCEYFHIPYNYLLVNGKEGVAQSAVLGEVTEKTALELAVIAHVDSIFQDKLETVETCVKLAMLAFVMILLFSAIGIGDTLYESYRARKDAFALYQYAGMSARTVRRMKAWEIFLCFVFGGILGILSGVVLTWVTQVGFYKFGMEMIRNALALFG